MDNIKLPEEFQSGNSIPIERATISADRMWEIIRDAVRSDEYRVAYEEGFYKTEFIQAMSNSGKISAKYLGWHRADVMCDLIQNKLAHYEAVLKNIAALMYTDGDDYCSDDEMIDSLHYAIMQARGALRKLS